MSRPIGVGASLIFALEFLEASEKNMLATRHDHDRVTISDFGGSAVSGVSGLAV